MLRAISMVGLLVLALAGAPGALGQSSATLYKNPGCSCCEDYADYLRENGLAVTVISTQNLVLIRREQGVPLELAGCHTTVIDGYVVEGHVPIEVIERLLRERPPIKGISLPGLPPGSPGMIGRKETPFTIYELSDGPPKVYAVE